MKSLNKLILSAVCLTALSTPEASAESLTKQKLSHFSADQLFPEIEQLPEIELQEIEHKK